jgi:ABC-type molybdate transport system permease subunit
MKFFSCGYKYFMQLTPMERVFFLLAVLSVAVSVFVFCFLFGAVFFKFLSNTSPIFWGKDNLLFQMLGSFLILSVAIPTMMFLATCAGLWRLWHFWQFETEMQLRISAQKANVNNKFVNLFDAMLLLLHSVPSIIWGIFGFALFVRGLEFGKSWVSGGLTLGFLGFPFLLETAISRGKQISLECILSAKALGMSKVKLINNVLLPYIFSGVLGGMRVTIPRILGETAPIILTASVFSGVTFPKGFVQEPVLSLPYHIYVLSQDVFDANAMQNAWNSVFVLIVFSFLLRALFSKLQGKLERNWFRA